MPETTLQVLGAVLGGLVVDLILWQLFFDVSPGEAVLGAAMFFWMGGCVVMPMLHLMGMMFGALAIVPLIDLCCAIVSWVRKRRAQGD